MLFSEPKIPQLIDNNPPVFAPHSMFQCSSASRKFLNTFPSQEWSLVMARVSVLFSEPKIPQCRRFRRSGCAGNGFSALQRAENSSMVRIARRGRERRPFQCSSASRKFLNPRVAFAGKNSRPSFSALQRAENSSIPSLPKTTFLRTKVSVLFSEPKIPQFWKRRSVRQSRAVSVLFSEPKIPQFRASLQRSVWLYGFSALQRAENSSMALLNTSDIGT